MVKFAIMVHYDDIHTNNPPRNAGDEIKLLVCDGFDPNTVPTNGRWKQTMTKKRIEPITNKCYFHCAPQREPGCLGNPSWPVSCPQQHQRRPTGWRNFLIITTFMINGYTLLMTITITKTGADGKILGRRQFWITVLRGSSRPRQV